MLQSRMQRPIPERLSHYTNLEALKSILSDQEGKGICLRAFSNRCKNDDQEIRMGEYMLKRVREVLPTNASLLNQFGGYENSASFSFNEGDVNEHMLEYGQFRLEFDLRDIGVGLLTDGIIDCEYVAESELEEYADEYCDLIANTFNSIPSLQKQYGKISEPPINYLIGFKRIRGRFSDPLSLIHLSFIEKTVNNAVWNTSESGKLSETCSKVEAGEYNLAALDFVEGLYLQRLCDVILLKQELANILITNGYPDLFLDIKTLKTISQRFFHEIL